MTYDLAVVGAGIVGLAHALAAARQGLRVVVLDRDAQANGASIRNFGLVVVSGQQPGQPRRHAERTREIWLDVAAQARIAILQEGLLVAAQRPEAMALAEAFAASEGGHGCTLLTAAAVEQREPSLAKGRLSGGLFSPLEIRVESRDVIPRLAEWLAERHGVEFRFGTSVHAVSPPLVETSRGNVMARKIVICPGDDLATLYPERIEQYGVRRCRLQMLRLAAPGHRLASAIVSDLSLIRYGGYASLPEAHLLKDRLEEQCSEAMQHGVHLIVAQSSDGSLVVGDSHHYGATPHPFSSEEVDRLITREYGTLFGDAPHVMSRWTGTYASATDCPNFCDTPAQDVRLVMITSGTGASTAFAIGEETISELFG